MNQTYYAMKRRLGGEKFTAREKLCWHWCPTPGCITHANIVGERRGEILFRKYCSSNRVRWSSPNPNLMYWRSHPAEWAAVQEAVRRR